MNKMPNTSRREFIVSTVALSSAGMTHLGETRAASVATLTAGPAVSPLTLIPNGSMGPSTSWDTFQRTREASTDVVQTIDFILSPTTVGPGSDLVIVADTIRIQAVVKLPSRNVWLFAREITFDSGAALDTSGLDGTPYQQRATDGTVPGGAGADGNPGAPGNPGGAVVMSARRIAGPAAINSNGGRGGKGQQGGTGAVGVTGPRGENATWQHREGDGLRGYAGGTGGVGGKGGDGGNAGLVQLLTLEPEDRAPEISAIGGLPGDVGDPGLGGPGGPGGPPGNNHFIEPPHGHRGGGGGDSWYSPGNPGPQGPQGSKAAPQTANGNSGLTQNYIPTSGDVSKIAEWATLTQLSMSLMSREIAFLNGDTAQLEASLQWIALIASTPGVGGSLAALRAHWIAPLTLPPAGAGDWSALFASTQTLLTRFRMGLNPFGYAPGYVSDLTSDFLKDQAKYFLDSASIVEKDYDGLSTESQSQADKVSALSSAIQNLQTDIQTHVNDVTDLNAYADSIQNDISTLSLQIATLERDLVTAQTAFQNSLPHVGNCSFSNLLNFAKGVIAISSGAYAGFIGLTNAIGTVNNLPPDTDLISKIKFIGDTFSNSDVASNFSKMQTGYNELQQSLTENSGKLVISLESFEQQLAQFDTVEARQYRDLLRSFVSLAQARNQKQLDYTQARIKAATARAQLDQLRAESNRAKDMLAQSNNPVLNDEVLFMGSYLQASKLWILELFDLVRRSITYATLTPIQQTYRALRVDDLRSSFDELTKEWMRQLDAQNGEMQTFAADFVLDFRRLPVLREQLETNSATSFTIPVDYESFNRGGTASVVVTEVTLDLSQIRSSTNRFTAKLVHQGNATLVSAGGALMTFFHRSRATNLLYDFSGGQWTEVASTANNLRGSADRFLYLSPFATWGFYVQSDTRINWTRVQQLVFKFKGKFIPRLSTRLNAHMRASSMLQKRIQSLLMPPAN